MPLDLSQLEHLRSAGAHARRAAEELAALQLALIQEPALYRRENPTLLPAVRFLATAAEQLMERTNLVEASATDDEALLRALHAWEERVIPEGAVRLARSGRGGEFTRRFRPQRADPGAPGDGR